MTEITVGDQKNGLGSMPQASNSSSKKRVIVVKKGIPLTPTGIED